MSIFGLNPIEFLIVAGILIAIGVAVLRGPIGKALRTKKTATEADIAKNLAGAVSLVKEDQVETGVKIADGELGKVKVNAALILIERRYNDALAQVEHYKNKAQAAAMAGRQDLVQKALERKAAAQTLAKGLEPTVLRLRGNEQTVKSAVAILKKHEANLKVEEQVISSGKIGAEVSMDANQILARLRPDGTTANLEKAHEALAELTAQSEAWEKLAQEAQKERSVEEELDALSTESVSVEDEVAGYMAKYGPKTDASVQ